MTGDPRFATESSNSAFANYEGKVIDAYFVEGEYGVTLDLKVELLHPELHPLIDGGLQTVKFNTGSKWKPVGDGDTIAHESGDADKKYFRNSQMGILAQRLAAGEMNNFDGFMAAIPADFSLYRASSWKGLTFRWDNATYMVPRPQWSDDAQTIPVNDARGRQVYKDEETERVFPVEFLGSGGAASNGQVVIDPVSLGLPSALFNALVDAAKSTETNGAFASAAIAAGGTGSPELMAVLADDAQVSALRAALVA